MDEIYDMMQRTKQGDPKGLSITDEEDMERKMNALLADIKANMPEVFEEINEADLKDKIEEGLKKAVEENSNISALDKEKIVEEILQEEIEKIVKQLDAKPLDNISNVKSDEAPIR